MWLSAIKLAMSAGSKIYANKQRTKWQCQKHNLYMLIVWLEERSIPRKTFRSPSIRLEGRGSFDNFKFARRGTRLGSRIGRSDCDGQSKIIF